MAKDQKTHSDGAQDGQGSALSNVILLALPLFCFQRNVLNLVKAGLERAAGVRPVQNLLLHEMQAALMILDPERKWRNRLGVDLENKLKGLVEETTGKVNF